MGKNTNVYSVWTQKSEGKGHLETYAWAGRYYNGLSVNTMGEAWAWLIWLREGARGGLPFNVP
jgi:hypothetical protein